MKHIYSKCMQYPMPHNNQNNSNPFCQIKKIKVFPPPSFIQYL